MHDEKFNRKRIIVFTPERLGDTLMCTPAIHYLKKNCPGIQIFVIALSPLSQEVLTNNPDIKQIYVLPSYKFLHRQEKFDYIINIHAEKLNENYIESLNIPTFTIPKIDPNLHQAEQALLFVQSLLSHKPPILDRQYRLFPDEKDEQYISELFLKKKVDINQDILIGCQIGCHSISKKNTLFLKKMFHPKIWPLEYIQAFSKICWNHNQRIKIIITGSQNEKKLAKELVNHSSNIVDFVNETSVPQLHALLKRLKVFVSPDTGLMHVACSANIPLVALFGPTILKRTGPYPELSDLTLIQASSMDQISPEEVFNAVIKKLQKSKHKEKDEVCV